MATVVNSSAITKTILNNKLLARVLLKEVSRRNIYLRRKSREKHFRCLGRISMASFGILEPLDSGSWMRDVRPPPAKPSHHPAFHQILYSTSQNPSRYGDSGCSWSRINLLSIGCMNVNITQHRTLWTSTICCDSEKVPSRSSALGRPWDTVQEKKEKFMEAKQEIIEDIKETKAKVREQVDAIIERENIWTVPNLLCISRILCSPFLCHLVMSSEYTMALGLFMFAGFTDLLDGWIARTFPGQASRLGSFLDPLADKILVAMLFLSLTYVGVIPLPLTVVIVYRDIVIIGGASFVRYKSLPPPKTIARYFDATHATAQLAPTTLSKINTAIQLSLITASLAAPVFGFSDHYLLSGLCWLTGVTTISSGITYIFSKDTYKILSRMRKT